MLAAFNKENNKVVLLTNTIKCLYYKLGTGKLKRYKGRQEKSWYFLSMKSSFNINLHLFQTHKWSVTSKNMINNLLKTSFPFLPACKSFGLHLTAVFWHSKTMCLELFPCPPCFWWPPYQLPESKALCTCFYLQNGNHKHYWLPPYLSKI